MLEEKIQRKRTQLNESIENHQKYEDVYKLSVELDELITEFYKETKERKNQKNKRCLGSRLNLHKILYII